MTTSRSRCASRGQDGHWKAQALRDLGTALAQAGQQKQASQVWAEAQRVIGTIQDDERLYEALKDLGTALTQAEQWTEAERVIGTIPGSSWQAEPLKDLATLMARTDNLEHLLHLIQRSWHQVESRKEALTFFSIAYAVISYKPEVGKAFFDAFIWVNTFLDG